MKNIINSFTNIFRRGNGSLTKIVLLGIGLAMGLTLIAKLYFENTYDSFVPDGDRTYRVLPSYVIDGKLVDFNTTPGGISLLIKREIPSVEIATRYTVPLWNSIIKSIENDNVRINKDGVLCKIAIIADTCFFKIFPRTTLYGNIEESMSSPNNAVITKSLADRMLEGSNNTYRDLYCKAA